MILLFKVFLYRNRAFKLGFHNEGQTSEHELSGVYTNIALLYLTLIVQGGLIELSSC